MKARNDNFFHPLPANKQSFLAVLSFVTRRRLGGFKDSNLKTVVENKRN